MSTSNGQIHAADGEATTRPGRRLAFRIFSSEGVEWGVVAVLGGLVFIAAAEWEARRARS